jgi:hypothetical protein
MALYRSGSIGSTDRGSRRSSTRRIGNFEDVAQCEEVLIYRLSHLLEQFSIRSRGMYRFAEFLVEAFNG